jgi:hypothetical protein
MSQGIGRHERRYHFAYNRLRACMPPRQWHWTVLINPIVIASPPIAAARPVSKIQVVKEIRKTVEGLTD